MSRTRLPSLAELRKRLKDDRAGRKSDVTAVSDADLFRAAAAGVQSLRETGRAEIVRTPPPPVPRPIAAAIAEETAPEPRPDSWIPAHWLEALPVTGSPEEQMLARAMQGVQTIRSDRIHHEAPKPRPIPLQFERDEQAALTESIYAPTPLELVLEGGDELHYLKEGQARSTLRDLRRGRWVVQAELDLHGANRDQARDLLAAAFAQWRKQDIRCVRIIHGKGLGSPGKEPVLKKLVAGWLMNYDDVLAYAQARVPDGGAGALLVLMRASRR